MKTEHFYTFAGRQRAVYVNAYGDTVTYSLQDAPTGSYVEYTDMPEELVRSGKASWFTLLDNEGPITGATAIRAILNGSPSPLSKMEVQSSSDAVMACAGQLARMNAVFAEVNSDMRLIAKAAA